MADEFNILVRVEERPDSKLFKGGWFAVYRVAKPFSASVMKASGGTMLHLQLREFWEEREERLDPIMGKMLYDRLSKAMGGA